MMGQRSYILRGLQLSLLQLGVYFSQIQMQTSYQEVDQWLELGYPSAASLTPDIFSQLLNESAPPISHAPSTSESVESAQLPVPAPAAVPRGRGKQRAVREGTRRGHWSPGENQLYHWFLEIHARHFLHSHLRRTDKIFKTMEGFIGTREAEQCRSHHQKMEKKLGEFRLILKELRIRAHGSTDPELVGAQLAENGVEWEGELMAERNLLAQSEPSPQLQQTRSEQAGEASWDELRLSRGFSGLSEVLEL